MTLNRERYARDKQRRIAKVCEISQNVIEESNYDELSMNLIHKLTQIPIGTLYKDFPDGKEDILLEILKGFQDEFSDINDKFNDNTQLRQYVYRALDVGRKRRKLIIAVQIETLKNPDTFLAKARKYMHDIDSSVFKKVMEYIVQHDLNLDRIYEMLTVWKALIRQHIIFRNLYGSDEHFFEMLVKIMRGLDSTDNF